MKAEVISNWYWTPELKIVRHVAQPDGISQVYECSDVAYLEAEKKRLEKKRHSGLEGASSASKASFKLYFEQLLSEVDYQLEYVNQRLSELRKPASSETFFHKKEKPENFLRENTPTVSPQKEAENFLRENTPTVPPQKEAENFLRENTSTFFHKKGRGKQKIPPSGSLVPVVQKKRNKQGRVVEYPRVEGERVPRELAMSYPHQFIWLYCWAVEDDGRWQKKSKSVPRNRIWLVKSAIASNKPVSEIISLINS